MRSAAQEERILLAAMAFVRKHMPQILLLSVLVLLPCFWHQRIEAGDLGSHVYNAWLANLVEKGQAPGVYLVQQRNNVLFDLALSWIGKWMGLTNCGCLEIVMPFSQLLSFWRERPASCSTPYGGEERGHPGRRFGFRWLCFPTTNNSLSRLFPLVPSTLHVLLLDRNR